MRLAIPLDLPSLDEALAFVQDLSPRLEREPVMTDREWEQAVTAAVGRRDHTGLAALLHAQLVPALVRAMIALGDTVRHAMAASQGDPRAHRMALANLLEPTQQAVMQAGKATWAGEHREGLQPGHAGPSRPPKDWGRGVWDAMSGYMQLDIAGDDVHQALAEDLGGALRRLTGPVRAAVECVDRGQLDELLAYPLQQALFGVYQVLASVRLYLLSTHMAEAELDRIGSVGPI
ncbi:MAG: hypothetical protein KDK70_34045 [Myxococcales bacterium]|nr:hypothetical protein [Myxococcales bacterium]